MACTICIHTVFEYFLENLIPQNIRTPAMYLLGLGDSTILVLSL